MPDLMTHYTIAHLAARRWWQPVTSIFLLGTLLPDLLTRPAYILWPQAYWLVMPLHTPVGSIIAGWMIAALFRLDERRQILMALVLGAFLHFALDALQRHLVAGYFWLWPFSWWTTERGLFWPEDSLLIAPLLALIVVLLEIVLYFKRHAHDHPT
jgi:hypothetical protein